MSDYEDDDLLAGLEDITNREKERRLGLMRIQTPQTESVIDLTTDKAAISMTVSHPLVLLHFYRPDFARCTIMHDRLQALAPRHPGTKFCRINVEDAPFLVTKLGIKVLPCVVLFTEGRTDDRIIGFEGLDGVNNFSVESLEHRLRTAGIVQIDLGGNMRKTGIKGTTVSAGDDDYDL